MRLLDLSVDQLESCRHDANMCTRGLGGTGGHGKRLLAQDLRRLCRCDPPDAVRFENAVDTTFADAGGLGRCWHRSPQFEEPIGAEIVADFERLRVIPPELLAHPVGEPVALLLQIFSHPRPLTQRNDDSILGCQMPKAVPVGAQGITEHMGVATVVLGTSNSEAVTKAVELLWVNRIDQKAAFEQRLDNRAVWHLDGHGDDRRLGPRRYQQPDTHLGKPGPAVGKSSLADDFAVRIDQTDLVSLARPVDADEPPRIVPHHFASRSLPGHRDARHSLYWRSRRDSPPDLHHSQPAGARVPPRYSKHRGQWVAPDRPARSSQSIIQTDR